MNKVCKKQFGSGIAYYDLVALRDGLTKPSSLVTPVEIPPEILEATTEPNPNMALTVAPVANPTNHPEFLGHLRSVRTWMAVNRIEELRMDDSGRVSVLAWSELDLGGDSDG